MAIFTSYDLEGKKLSFANWISNLSPTDTFFVSVTGKERVKQTKFQWQTDSLAQVDYSNAQKEDDDAIAYKKCDATVEHENVTQILRKAIEVTDTADSLDNYGRNSELAYQMEKAGKEIKRDLEAILLSKQVMHIGANNDPRKTATFPSLVADGADTVTTAEVKRETATANKIVEQDLFDLTYNLYLAGSDANTIMYHPKMASFFSSLMEVAPAGGNRIKMIDNLETKLNKFVGSLIDPLGQEYKLIPNRWMPEETVYVFNPKDWTQMVLRAPEKVKLAKTGSSEKYMIEMEVGLRHRNPYASGILTIKK